MRFSWGYLFVAVVLIALLNEADAQVTRNRQRTRQLSNVRRRNNRLNTRSGRLRVANARRASLKAGSSRTKSKAASTKLLTKIVRGTVTDISEMPFQVQVRHGSTLCGGSLIDPEWVLTAAHCAKGVSASKFIIYAGTSTLYGSDAIKSTVNKTIVAPKYKSNTINMDAALLKLNTPLNGTNIEVVSMATRRPKAGSALTIGGWGVTREGGSVSKKFRTAQIHVVRQQKCVNRYRGSISITQYMICATSRKRDSCSGDSGGGVTHNGKLVALVSFGAGCANSGYPGVYTNIPMIRSWIKTVMANNS